MPDISSKMRKPAEGAEVTLELDALELLMVRRSSLSGTFVCGNVCQTRASLQSNLEKFYLQENKRLTAAYLSKVDQRE